MRDAAVVPYFMVLNHKTGEWTADCKFCDFTSRRCNYPINAGAEVISHAKKPVSEGGGGHYDELSGLYYSAEGMQREKDRRKERRTILGSHEDTMNLNQAGL